MQTGRLVRGSARLAVDAGDGVTGIVKVAPGVGQQGQLGIGGGQIDDVARGLAEVDRFLSVRDRTRLCR